MSDPMNSIRASGVRPRPLLPNYLLTALPILLGILSILGGCAVGPDFSKPAPSAQAGYRPEPVTLPPAGPTDPQQHLQSGSEEVGS